MFSLDANRARTRIAALVLCCLAAGCAGGENVSKDAMKLAKARWDKANVRDYQLEWTSSVPAGARYVVSVRDRKVVSLESVAPDGRRYPAKPADPSYYGVDGLFVIIADELAQLDLNTPFGHPKGSRTVMKFTPDPVYGFPLSYRRDVVGAPVALTIDVVRFEPAAAR